MFVAPTSGRAAVRRTGAIATTFTLALGAVLLLGHHAHATEVEAHLTVAPGEAALGSSLAVSGACPESVAAPFVRATVRLEELDRSVELPVEDGAFTGSVEVTPGVGGKAPEPGTMLTALARCRTEVGVVAAAGDEQFVAVVAAPPSSASPTASSARPTARVKSVSRAEKRRARREADATPTPTPVATTASTAPVADSPINPTVPLIALAVAVVGSIATLTMSARRTRREREG